jgi:glycosyltransferase involved in cell wall biosynthesis
VILFFAISIFVTGLIYSALLIYCIVGWQRLPEFNLPENLASDQTFSIIIPARNEEENIQECLLDIIDQNYNKASFEVIVVDDFSEDGTVNQIENIKKNYPECKIHIIQLEKMLKAGRYNSYKKLAIEQGIFKSSFEWIITTDADCRREENWLQTISSFIDKHKGAKLISAPVCFTFNNSFFQKAQALEFSGLIGIGAACIAHKSPTMCNGANLI